MAAVDVRIQCLLDRRVADWPMLKEFSQLDKVTAKCVAGDWEAVFEQHYGRYLHIDKDWKPSYAKLSRYIQEGVFYKMRDPGVIRWEYLVDIPEVFDAFEAKPLLHLWSNVLFYSTFGDSSWSVRLFDAHARRSCRQ